MSGSFSPRRPRLMVPDFHATPHDPVGYRTPRHPAVVARQIRKKLDLCPLLERRRLATPPIIAAGFDLGSHVQDVRLNFSLSSLIAAIDGTAPCSAPLPYSFSSSSSSRWSLSAWPSSRCRRDM